MKTTKEFLDELFLVQDKNLDFLEDLITYLNNPFPLISSPKSIYNHEIKNELIDAFIEKVSPLNDKENAKKYLKSAICFKNILKYKNNPYLKLLDGVSFNSFEWELSKITIKPYEIFIAGNSYMQGDSNKYFAQLGFLKEEYSYPSLSLCGREWMSLSPNEIETMDLPIKAVKGKILVLGLGLGYFAYMASIKEEVKDVYVVEMDKNIINIFKESILPKFEHKEKIHIIKDDAFRFIESVNDEEYDYIFSDLWHDVSDGCDMYLKLKSRLDSFKYTRCLYWIEESIVTQLSMYVTGALYRKDDSPLYAKLKELKLNDIYDELIEEIEESARAINIARNLESEDEEYFEFEDSDFIDMVYFSVHPTTIDSIKLINDTMGYLNPTELDKEILQACDAEQLIFINTDVSDIENIEKSINFNTNYYYIVTKEVANEISVELENFYMIEEFEMMTPEALNKIAELLTDYDEGFEEISFDESRGAFSKLWKGIKKAAKKIQNDSDVLVVIGIGGSYLGHTLEEKTINDISYVSKVSFLKLLEILDTLK